MEFQAQPPTNSLTPVFSIWIQPRRTIRAIVDTDPGKHVILLAMLAGISQVLDNMSTRNAGDTISLPVILGLALVLGPLAGVISLYFGSVILRFTGSLLGGQATTEEIRAATAWAAVPTLVTLPLWVPLLLLVGEELFTTSTPRLEANPLLALPLVLISMVQLAMALWSLVLLAKTLGEVNRFSAWKGLGSALLPVLVIFVVAFCAVIALGMS